MRELKVPSREEIEQLKEAVGFNPYEKTYWEDMITRRDAQFDEKDYQGHINFYLLELQATDGNFKERVAVERRLKYMIAHAYESSGTFTLEGFEPLERAEMFEKAVLWYQSADESVGFHSDYSLRQAESCFGAAKYRKDAGLEDQVTEAFVERGTRLCNAFSGGRIGRSAEVTIVCGTVPEYLKQIADIKVDTVAEAYLFRGHSNDHMPN